MKKCLLILFLLFIPIRVLILLPMKAHAQLYWNKETMKRVKDKLEDEPYKSAYKCLIEKAETCMDERNVSIVDDSLHIPASGNIHDYFSLARYAWPDSTKADGLPYIERDGYTNPEYYDYDRETMLKMIERVKTLTLAWFYSDSLKYADAAVEQLRTWFIRNETLMNPNLIYGQHVKGYDDYLNPTGVLEGADLVNLIDALYILESYHAKNWKSDLIKIKKWYRELLKWIETSKQGKLESKAPDNTGTSYDLQRFAFHLYCGDKNKAQGILESFIKNRIFRQIDERGIQTEEIQRTSSFGYCVSNITVIVDFPQIRNHPQKMI